MAPLGRRLVTRNRLHKSSPPTLFRPSGVDGLSCLLILATRCADRVSPLPSKAQRASSGPLTVADGGATFHTRLASNRFLIMESITQLGPLRHEGSRKVESSQPTVFAVADVEHGSERRLGGADVAPVWTAAHATGLDFAPYSWVGPSLTTALALGGASPAGHTSRGVTPLGKTQLVAGVVGRAEIGPVRRSGHEAERG
jgi:hypothetical protein